MTSPPTVLDAQSRLEHHLLSQLFSPRRLDPSQYKVLLLDKTTSHQIHSCLQVHDLVAQSVVLLHCVDEGNKRPPLRFADAIYYLTPQSIPYVLEDWNDSRGSDGGVDWSPPYRAPHLFFTNRLTAQHMSLLSRAPIARRLQTLVDGLGLFHAPEQRLLLLPALAQRFTLSELYRPQPNKDQLLQSFMSAAAHAIRLSMGSNFHVRFPKGSALASRAAPLLQKSLGSPKQSTQVVTVVLLDRGLDASTPLLHSLSYEAMCHDLLAEKERHTEDSPFWKTFRHEHLVRVLENLKKHVEEQQKDMSSAMLNPMDRHVHRAEKLMRLYSGELTDLVECEQTLVSGVVSDGERTRTVSQRELIQQVQSILSTPSLSRVNKERLALLLHSRFPTVGCSASPQLIAGLSKLCSAPLRDAQTFLGPPHYAQRLRHDTSETQQRGKANCLMAGERRQWTLDSARCESLVERVAGLWVAGELERDEFPFVIPPVTSEEPRQRSSSFHRFRLRAPSLKGWGGGTVGGLPKVDEPTMEDSLVILLLSSVVYEELSGLSRISQTSQRNMLVIAPAIQGTSEWLRELSELGNDGQRQSIHHRRGSRRQSHPSLS